MGFVTNHYLALCFASLSHSFFCGILTSFASAVVILL